VWILLTPYDSESPFIHVNADMIQTMEDGSRTKKVNPPTTIRVGVSTIRVTETPEEILDQIIEESEAAIRTAKVIRAISDDSTRDKILQDADSDVPHYSEVVKILGLNKRTKL